MMHYPSVFRRVSPSVKSFTRTTGPKNCQPLPKWASTLEFWHKFKKVHFKILPTISISSLSSVFSCSTFFTSSTSHSVTFIFILCSRLHFSSSFLLAFSGNQFVDPILLRVHHPPPIRGVIFRYRLYHVRRDSRRWLQSLLLPWLSWIPSATGSSMFSSVEKCVVLQCTSLILPSFKAVISVASALNVVASMTLCFAVTFVYSAATISKSCSTSLPRLGLQRVSPCWPLGTSRALLPGLSGLSFRHFLQLPHPIIRLLPWTTDLFHIGPHVVKDPLGFVKVVSVDRGTSQNGSIFWPIRRFFVVASLSGVLRRFRFLSPLSVSLRWPLPDPRLLRLLSPNSVSFSWPLPTPAISLSTALTSVPKWVPPPRPSSVPIAASCDVLLGHWFFAEIVQHTFANMGAMHPKFNPWSSHTGDKRHSPNSWQCHRLRPSPLSTTVGGKERSSVPVVPERCLSCRIPLPQIHPPGPPDLVRFQSLRLLSFTSLSSSHSIDSLPSQSSPSPSFSPSFLAWSINLQQGPMILHLPCPYSKKRQNQWKTCKNKKN